MRFKTFDMTLMKLTKNSEPNESYVLRHVGTRPDHLRSAKHTRVSNPDRVKPGLQV